MKSIPCFGNCGRFEVQVFFRDVAIATPCSDFNNPRKNSNRRKHCNIRNRLQNLATLFYNCYVANKRTIF